MTFFADSRSYTVDNAATQIGKNGSGVNAYLIANGETIDATRYDWCTSFVNASLHAAGIDGTQSNIATSFAEWGQLINGMPERGDVLIVGIGNSASLVNQVGIATSVLRYNIMTGGYQYEMIVGNSPSTGVVSYCWQNPWAVTIRRSWSSMLVPVRIFPDNSINIAISDTGTISSLVPYGDSMLQAQLLSGIAQGETGGNINLNLATNGNDLLGSQKDIYGFPIWSDVIGVGPYRYQRQSFAILASRLGLNFQNSADQNAALWYDAINAYDRWAAAFNPQYPTLMQALNLGAFDDIQTALTGRWNSVYLANYLRSGVINKPLIFGRTT